MEIDVLDLMDKLDSEVDEDFYDHHARDSHYKDHVNGDYDEWPVGYFDTPRDYEIAANLLAITPSHSSDINSQYDIVGFMQDDYSCVKYDKIKKEMVIYKNDRNYRPVKIITYFKTDDYKYNKRFKERYKRDLTIKE